MEEMRSVNESKGAQSNKAPANIKSMTTEEQLNYYKSLFQKSKKLAKYYDEEIKKLKEKLSQYEGESGKVCELLFTFKYETDTFYFFKNESQRYFINEKLLSDTMTKEISSNPTVKTYDYNKDLKSKDEYLSQIILQYEDKLKRILKENELNESKIKAVRTSNDSLLKELTSEKEKYELSIQNSIQGSNDILVHLNNVLDVDLTDESVKNEVYSKMKTLIDNLSSHSSDSTWYKELIVFHQKVLRSYLDTVFKMVEVELKEISQKNKWQSTIDQLILSQEEEKNKMFKTIEQNKINIKSLNQKIVCLEQEKYNIGKQKDLTIEMLNKQINKGVNMNYLKNILMSFLTTKEESIQEGLLPVIFTSLQFNEGEMKVVKDARKKQSSGSLLSFFKAN